MIYSSLVPVNRKIVALSKLALPLTLHYTTELLQALALAATVQFNGSNSIHVLEITDIKIKRRTSFHLKKYGELRTFCKSKSPLFGSGGKSNPGYEVWKPSSNCKQIIV
ncbi:hypothetical protein RIF29_10586 [Crotalaria pallida]|uniref:Uncharacterized protein n=1 Tax=Crotalaria pallida TaxID=3830 RepID=A0AAN9IIF8_CROPI